jgi:hypothetical protein
VKWLAAGLGVALKFAVILAIALYSLRSLHR